MNYYERHLGDYSKDTSHLSLLEHGAYTLLLDRYYSTERPIEAAQAHRLARARTKEERAAVDAVLEEFFALEDGLWRHARCDAEIAKAQTKIKAARENGSRGGRPKKNPEQTQEKPSGFLLGSDQETQQKAHQTPDTRHQEENSTASVPGDPGTETPRAADCPHAEIVALYHEKLPMLRPVRIWNEKRQGLLRQRWREDQARQSLSWWADFFAYVGTCPLLVGEHSSRGHEGWQADLEWLLTAGNFVKVLEGKYERRQAA